MASITAIANDFFAACETGKGWEICKAYCAPNATFAAQAEPLADIKTLAEYADWMTGVTTAMPDSSYEVKSFATDTERSNVAAYAIFSGTHTGPGGPCEPTGKKNHFRLRLRDAIHRRQDQPRDEDLAFWHGFKATWLGLRGQRSNCGHV
ncbi:putative ester cyclase [Bradyrhizobium sp. AZCC 1578]|uniref:ester cyclase n=1 Tax=Bradyrhizobium sp. AZCC 1578 TaxID=3117027 RepID=UPI002FF3BEE6